MATEGPNPGREESGFSEAAHVLNASADGCSDHEGCPFLRVSERIPRGARGVKREPGAARAPGIQRLCRPQVSDLVRVAVLGASSGHALRARAARARNALQSVHGTRVRRRARLVLGTKRAERGLGLRTRLGRDRMGLGWSNARIVVLGGGTIIERGTHAELLRAGGYYARLAANTSCRGRSRRARRASEPGSLKHRRRSDARADRARAPRANPRAAAFCWPNCPEYACDRPIILTARSCAWRAAVARERING